MPHASICYVSVESCMKFPECEEMGLDSGIKWLKLRRNDFLPKKFIKQHQQHEEEVKSAMTVPLPSVRPKQSILLLTVKVLLIILVILLLPQLVQVEAKSKANKRRKLLERKLNGLKQHCRSSGKCSEKFIPYVEESLNCVAECMSSTCYSSFFEDDPLEDGEINYRRWSQFENCVKAELQKTSTGRKF